MKRRRLIWQIFPSFLSVIVLAVALTVWYANRTARDLLVNQTREQLYTAAVAGVDHAGTLLTDPEREPLQQWAVSLAQRIGLRITVILPDGTVIADSDESPRGMENHADRPEIQEALRDGLGEQTRHSGTVNKQMMYLAVSVPGPSAPLAVFRTSSPLASLRDIRDKVAGRIVLTGFICIVIGAVASFILARRITDPVKDLQSAANRLAEGEFDAHLRLPESRELASLAASFNCMAGQLEDRIDTVTHQKNEAEAILASMVEGVVAVDQEQNVLNLNVAAANMLGLNRDRVIGRSIQEVIRNPGLYKMVTKTLNSEVPVEGDIVLHREANEQYLQVHGSRLPAQVQAGQTGAVLVLNDVTRLRRLERMRKDFAANVSHELRTPITSITGFVETLLDGALDDREDAERFLNIIRQHADRLSALIADLLSLAGIEKEEESGGIPLETKDLAPEIRRAVATRRSNAEDKNIQVSVDCPEQLQAPLNSSLFAQAIVNLLDNAINYSPPDTSVRVVAEKDEAGDHVRVCVIDEGRGIAPEHLERLFERFYRVDKARNRADGGTGLGLAIVKHVVQAHHGRIEVDSTPGQGSTFTIVLPLG